MCLGGTAVLCCSSHRKECMHPALFSQPIALTGGALRFPCPQSACSWTWQPADAVGTSPGICSAHCSACLPGAQPLLTQASQQRLKLKAGCRAKGVRWEEQGPWSLDLPRLPPLPQPICSNSCSSQRVPFVSPIPVQHVIRPGIASTFGTKAIFKEAGALRLFSRSLSTSEDPESFICCIPGQASRVSG